MSLPFATITLGVLLLFSTSSQAQDEVLEVLTCSPSSKGEMQWMVTLQELMAQTQRSDNGISFLAKEFTGDGICIRNAYIAVAFGVIAVGAEFCGKSTQAIIDFIRARNKDLVLVEKPPSAGVLADYNGGKRGFSLFKGVALPEPKIDPTSSRISYICAYQAGGAQ